MGWIKYMREREESKMNPRYWTKQLKFRMKLPSTEMRKVEDRKKIEASILLNIRCLSDNQLKISSKQLEMRVSLRDRSRLEWRLRVSSWFLFRAMRLDEITKGVSVIVEKSWRPEPWGILTWDQEEVWEPMKELRKSHHWGRNKKNTVCSVWNPRGFFYSWPFCLPYALQNHLVKFFPKPY